MWSQSRSTAWAGCNATPPEALSQQWLSTAPGVGFVYQNQSDGKLWSSAECKGVVFRGLPQKLSSNWGMCDGFTTPSRLTLADGS